MWFSCQFPFKTHRTRYPKQRPTKVSPRREAQNVPRQVAARQLQLVLPEVLDLEAADRSMGLVCKLRLSPVHTKNHPSWTPKMVPRNAWTIQTATVGLSFLVWSPQNGFVRFLATTKKGEASKKTDPSTQKGDRGSSMVFAVKHLKHICNMLKALELLFARR